MISPSAPEPRCDVAAQVGALVDPRHPKDAVWIARGTVAPPLVDAWAIEHDAGLLLTTSRLRAEFFAAHPSDDCLAAVLGYIEPKSHITGEPYIVRALDQNGSVISEMACSADAVEAARAALAGYGIVEVTTPVAALERRALLRALEGF